MGDARTSVYVDGLGHGGQPIPNACRLGDLVWSGGVNGLDRASGRVPAEIADEMANMFANVVAIAAAAGIGVERIVRMTVFVRQRADALTAALNAEWVAMFPDPSSRPARHVQVGEIHAALQVQCEFVAVAGGS